MVQSHVSYRWTTSQCQLDALVAAGNPDYSRSKADRVKRVGPGTGTLSVRPLTARGVPLTARVLFVGLTFAARA